MGCKNKLMLKNNEKACKYADLLSYWCCFVENVYHSSLGCEIHGTLSMPLDL